MKETQEMREYPADNNIVSEIELITLQYINEPYERMAKGDAHFRFVIDLSSIK